MRTGGVSYLRISPCRSDIRGAKRRNPGSDDPGLPKLKLFGVSDQESASAVALDLAIAFLIFSALADSSVSFALARNLSRPPR